jgi:hypothetical protein
MTDNNFLFQEEIVIGISWILALAAFITATFFLSFLAKLFFQEHFNGSMPS